MKVRTGKILLAVLLLLVGTQETFNMWRQTGGTRDVLIAVSIILLLCVLLLRNALKRHDPLVPSSKGGRIFWNVVGALCALSIVGNVLGFGKPPKPELVVQVNALQVPIDACVDGAVNMFKKKHDRIAFCTCLANKLGGDSGVVNTHRSDLLSGNMEKVAEQLQRTPGYDISKLADCMADAEDMSWTDIMLNRVKEECLTRMKSDGSDVEYDVEIFCDCLANKVSLLPPSIVARGDTTGPLGHIHAECSALSRRTAR